MATNNNLNENLNIEYDTENRFENKIHYFDVLWVRMMGLTFLEDLNRLPIVHMKLFYTHKHVRNNAENLKAKNLVRLLWIVF